MGIYFRDSRTADPSHLKFMMKALGHRGPDDRHFWNEGPAGLGHVMLWTTPESLHEKLPLADELSGIVITADARIDNRDDLIVALWGSGEPAKSISDSQIILRAYQKWGEGCPERLVGDFAFCIVDRRRHMVFCARDASGDRPFYYYLSDKVFVFGSEIRALLRPAGSPETAQRNYGGRLSHRNVRRPGNHLLPRDPAPASEGTASLSDLIGAEFSATGLLIRARNCAWVRMSNMQTRSETCSPRLFAAVYEAPTAWRPV